MAIHYCNSKKDAQKLRAELIDIGVNSWVIGADFEKAKECETLIARTLKFTGSLDILVNNASVFLPDTLQRMDYQALTRHIRINAWAPFVLSRQFAKVTRKGKIINLLDSRINSYDRLHVAYILSKQMLSTLTKYTALEFAPNIMVNGIAPALILPPKGKNQRYLDRMADTVPQKRHGDPNDVADAVIYLLKSDFLTGQIINVDGGLNLMEYAHGPYINP
ncbi:MAG: SDR family oxidoreductase [Candidatus Zixiibacteriota bacterium]